MGVMITGIELNVGNAVQVGASWPAALIAAFNKPRAGEIGVSRRCGH
jgi:hypothetical protein